MQFQVLAGIIALAGFATAQTVNIQTFSDVRDCSGPPTFNQQISQNICQNGQTRSLQIQPGEGDSNGCFVETYQDSNCGLLQGRIGPLSGGFSSCIGQGNPNTGEFQDSFSFRLLC